MHHMAHVELAILLAIAFVLFAVDLYGRPHVRTSLSTTEVIISWIGLYVFAVLLVVFISALPLMPVQRIATVFCLLFGLSLLVSRPKRNLLSMSGRNAASEDLFNAFMLRALAVTLLGWQVWANAGLIGLATAIAISCLAFVIIGTVLRMSLSSTIRFPLRYVEAAVMILAGSWCASS